MPLSASLLFGLLLSVASGSDLFGANLTRWSWPSSAVSDTHLFLDGGEYVIGYDNPVFSTQTFIMDLTQSWSSDTIIFTSVNKPDSFPIARRPVTWYSSRDTTLYAWAGWAYYDYPNPAQPWALKLDNNGVPQSSWAITSTENIPTNYWPPWASSYTVLNNALFSAGGVVATTDGFIPTPGLLELTISSESWSNHSLPDQESTLMGQAVALPSFGTEGVLLFMGGQLLDGEMTFTDYSDDTNRALQDMSAISVYDIASQTSYSQKADGDVPPNMWGFCAVSVKGQFSQYDVFIYGGGGQGHMSSSGNVFILSIPAFQWTKIATPSHNFTLPSENTCQVIGNSQMISVGGWGDPSGNGVQDLLTSDPEFANNLRIFDMNALTWGNDYNASADPYQRADLVVRRLNGQKEPTRGWKDPALSKIFALSGSGNGLGSPNPTPHKNNTGAIAGGVVGGIVALVVLALLVWWLLRQRRRHSVNSGQENHHHHQDEKIRRAELADTEPAPAEMPTKEGQTWEMDATAAPSRLGTPGGEHKPLMTNKNRDVVHEME